MGTNFENAKVILDPFMGSGTVALGAINKGKKYIGFELSKDTHALAEKRISAYLLITKEGEL